MRSTRRNTIRFYSKQFGKKPLNGLVIFAAIFLGVAMESTVPFFYKDMINLMSNPEGEVSAALYRNVFLIAAGYFLSFLGWRIASYIVPGFQNSSMAEIMNYCFEVIHNHSYNFFNNNFVGGFVKKVNRMARSFEDVTDMIFWNFWPLTIRIVLTCAMLFYLKPILGVAMLTWIFFYLGINYAFSIYKLKKFDIVKAEADTRVTARLSDTFVNSINVKLFANLKFELAEFKKISDDWRQKTQNSWIMNSHSEFIQGFFMVGINFLIIYFAVGLWLNGSLTVGDFALIETYLASLFWNLWDFGRNIRNFYERIADAEEMTVILDEPIEVKNVRGAGEIKLGRGEIVFDKVSFTYSGTERGAEESDEDDLIPMQADLNTDAAVIKKLSLKIKPGEKVALIGPSGGGKSTIVKLILRLFNIDSGKILLDGQDISKCTQDSLRSQIALVPQDPILFHRSLMENIRYGRPDASDKEVFAAAQLANCHDFISSFPKKYGTFVGERGVKLSGGERQRVAIARAILTNAKILILDEATSSLDSESERLIQDALKKLMKNKTTLVIAHRLSTIVQMDRILVLKEGEIIEEGSHSSLVARDEGIYKKLWELQSLGYL